MTEIELVPDDYEVPEGNNFQSFPDGKCKVKSFSWFTKDEKDRPILIAQKDGKLVGRFRFNLENGDDGPPMSVTLYQMPMVAKAFGIDIKSLPSLPLISQSGLVSQYMANLESKCKEKGKVLEVDVSGGWVNSLPGMVVPPGYYYFRVVDITGDVSSGVLKPRKSKKDNWLDYFYVDFEILAGEGGSESPYKGVRFTDSLSYAFEVVDNKVVAQKKKDGSFTAAAARISRFVRLTAPEAFVSNFNPPNPNNILPYMRDHVLSENRVIKGTLVKEEKGSRVFLSWPSIEEASSYDAPKRIIEEMNIDNKIRYVLVEVLEKLAGGQSVVVNGTLDFTDAGKKVAKDYLSNIRKEGLIQHGHLEELTPEEITTILTVLQGKVDESLVEMVKEAKEKVVMLGVGFEPPAEEEDDSPF